MSAVDTDYREIAITTGWQKILNRSPARNYVWTSGSVPFSWVYYDLKDGESEPPWEGTPQAATVFQKDGLPSASALWVKGDDVGILRVYIPSSESGSWS